MSRRVSRIGFAEKIPGHASRYLRFDNRDRGRIVVQNPFLFRLVAVFTSALMILVLVAVGLPTWEMRNFQEIVAYFACWALAYSMVQSGFEQYRLQLDLHRRWYWLQTGFVLWPFKAEGSLDEFSEIVVAPEFVQSKMVKRVGGYRLALRFRNANVDLISLGRVRRPIYLFPSNRARPNLRGEAIRLGLEYGDRLGLPVAYRGKPAELGESCYVPAGSVQFVPFDPRERTIIRVLLVLGLVAMLSLAGYATLTRTDRAFSLDVTLGILMVLLGLALRFSYDEPPQKAG